MNTTDNAQTLPAWRLAFFNDLTSRIDLRGKRVLEIGAGDCRISRLIVETFAPEFLFATDLKIPEGIDGQLLTLNCDATAMPFPADYFDVVYSHNVFEHITGLEKAWQEIGRILKPGGKIFTHFAPVWTHAFGHHVYVESENDFQCAIPPYGHLYMDRAALDRIIRQTTSPVSRARLAARTLLFDDGCNKMWPPDYRAIFDQAGVMTCLERIEHDVSHHDRPIPPALLAAFPKTPEADFRVFGWTILAQKTGGGQISDIDPRTIVQQHIDNRPKPSIAKRVARIVKKIYLSI